MLDAGFHFSTNTCIVLVGFREKRETLKKSNSTGELPEQYKYNLSKLLFNRRIRYLSCYKFYEAKKLFKNKIWIF